MDGHDAKDSKQSTADMTAFVQNLLQQMQTRFQTNSDSIISKIDEIGNRIDDEDSCESVGSFSDDSDEDPSYNVVEEKRRKFSSLLVRNKSSPSVLEESDDGMIVDDGEVEEVDEKSYDEVQRIIGAGNTEKLKVEQCKVYLRKNGLRLTGNKATLIQRINEHLEILDGGGEKKYPVSSFFMNCKGDACTGDVVLFEQNVYDMYNIASRSASGPPCGTRMVAGRVVKESYGAAKQQHTFTVEVLWSKGEKPLPPLHPLLIKGRNLYRLKTMRQRWDNEEERRRMLIEKHARGSLARSSREARIEEKEKRKGMKENRASKREPRKNQPRPDSTSVLKPSVQPRQSVVSDHSRSRENPMIRSEAPQRFTGNAELGFYPGIQEVQCARINNQRFTGLNTNHRSRREYDANNYHRSRREYGANNYQRPISPPRRENFVPRKACHDYARGRCRYGETCKFSHSMRE